MDDRTEHVDGRTGLEILPAAECRALLEAGWMGRLALSFEDQPFLFPVNYSLDGDDLVFRTAAGTKLAVIERNDVVVFEIDGIDEDTGRAWSVIVHGTAELVTDPDELAALGRPSAKPVARGGPKHVVRLRPTQITGRRSRVRVEEET